MPNMTRIKKQINQDQDILMKARHICDDFKQFTDGIRVMFLIHRSKEGSEHTNNEKLRKLISNNPKEFEENLYMLLVQKEESENPLRIYSSVNHRDIGKAIRKFKMEQLDADYFDVDSRNQFYFDVKNRFIGTLMSPSSASSSYFIIDIDEPQELNDVLKVIAEANLNDRIIKQYATKNGWHIVMYAFNPALIGVHSPKIHKDSLLLLNY